ncbi:MAG: divergent polysaccharide deacetylase family protein [bacterium]
MKKRGGRRKKRRTKGLFSKKNRLFWVFLGLILLSVINLILLDALVSFRAGWHFLPEFIYGPVVSFFSPKPSEKPPGPLPKEKEKGEKRLPVKDYTKLEPKLPKKPKPLKEGIEKKIPTIALVIDDLGYNPNLAEELFKIDLPFTVSVLPNLPYTNLISRRAIQKGKEVILHLPMEPYDYPNAQVEEGTLLISMKDEEIRRLIKKALKDLDCAVGANNHMGSRMVENEEKMRIILEEMKKRGLFFLDSRTSPRSLVYDLAKEMGVKTAKRHVFLDVQNNEEYVIKQLDQVADIALNNGYGIAIGHLQPSTIRALRNHLPDLSKRGIRFVVLSEVME